MINYSEKELEKEKDLEKSTYSTHLVTFFSMISSLLGSSCCIIQLILNIFSVGCAGFAILDKYEIYFLFITSLSIGILLKLKGIKNTYKIILICIAISASKRIVNMFLKDAQIKSNVFLTVKGVKCNGCALKLCSELKTIAKKCSIDSLNPPIANISLEVDSNVKEELIRNKIIAVNLDYRILEFKFLKQKF